MHALKLNIVMATLLLGATCATAGEVDREAIVTAHNKWRAEVGVGKLSYSRDLEVSAQAWADALKKTNRCQMRHSSPEGKYGENLFWASAVKWSDGRRELQKVSSDRPVDAWATEKANYDYASNSCEAGKVCGHYTQVVWKASTKVGCAYAVCEDSHDQVWVCQYQPAGNVIGRKPY